MHCKLLGFLREKSAYYRQIIMVSKNKIENKNVVIHFESYFF